jgi:hypothetical protein
MVFGPMLVDPTLNAARNEGRSGSISANCAGRANNFASVSGTGILRPINGSTISENFAGCAVDTTIHLPGRLSATSRAYTYAAVAVCGHQI